jgi:hypothetical protein
MWANLSLWFDIGLAVSGGLGGIFAGLFYSKVKIKAQERKAVEEASISPKNSAFQSKHTVVHETLTALRIKTGADRARIGHFHNGGKFLDGTPMKKFSITHESCERGIPYDGANLQNILVTMFWDLVETMRMDTPSLHWSMDMREGYFRSYNNANGITAYSVLPIMKGDLYIGFITLEWFGAEKTPSRQDSFELVFSQAKDYIELELALR